MFIGRQYEREQISSCLADSSKAQLIVLYGRRRVGKSRLIRECLRREEGVLYFEGIEGEPSSVQITQFLTDLSRQTGRVRLGARNWREVFQGLGELLAQGRWIMVFDELPWMAAGRSALIADLKLHWDRWSQINPKIALFLCGSVASFMTKHVVHSRALHNRKTLEILLKPLSPWEAAGFLSRRDVDEQIKMYLCLGGIPKYLEQLDPRSSIERNLNRLCFSKNGFFVEEYETLFKEQFRSTRVYQDIVEVLSRQPCSLSEMTRKTKVAKGGGFKEYVDNLVRAQFVREYRPLPVSRGRGTRTVKYKLTDYFLSFYFRYIWKNRNIISRNTSENLFRSIVMPSINQYLGFMFERLCEDAILRILDRVGVGLADIRAMGPYFQQHTYVHSGVQVDWLVLRRDGTCMVFEYKFRNTPVGMEIVPELTRKIERLNLRKQYSVETVLVSAQGATADLIKSNFFDHILTAKDLVATI